MPSLSCYAAEREQFQRGVKFADPLEWTKKPHCRWINMVTQFDASAVVGGTLCKRGRGRGVLDSKLGLSPGPGPAG